MLSAKKSGTTIAIFTPADEGGFDVFFPHFPGCATFGRTLGEAKRMAREVLELWIEELASTKSSLSTRAVIANVSLPRASKFARRSPYETARRQKARAHS